MAGAKRYSAGSIFLQVVPVFKNVQRDIQNEAKGWDRVLGDELEKSGEKAGERAGKAASAKMTEELKKGSNDYAGHFETQMKRAVQSANKELRRLDFSTASEGMLNDLEKAQALLKKLDGQDFSVNFNAKEFEADIKRAEELVKRLTLGKHEINIDSNLEKVLAEVRGAMAVIKRETDRKFKVEIEPDTRKISTFEKSFRKTIDGMLGHLKDSSDKTIQGIAKDLASLGDTKIGLDMDATEARTKLDEITAKIEVLRAQHPSIDVKMEIAKALAEAKLFSTYLDRLDHRHVSVEVDTNQARASLAGLTSSGDDAANSFRSFNLIMLAVAGAGPALVPILGAIAGGLLAIGPAAAVAGASIGAVLVGFSGLSGALTALQNKQDQAAMNAQRNAKAGLSASKQSISSDKAEIASAQRVADARRTAARQIADAIDSMRQAQENYKQSIQDVKDAEQALADARAAHKNDGQDINNRIAQNQLDLQQGLLDEFNAKTQLDAVLADGSSTNADKAQARIDFKQAQLRMKELREEQKKLAAEKKKWDKEGVNGTDAVKSAQDQLTAAIQRQKDALHALRKAQQGVDRARADGARNVREAIAAQAEALRQQDLAAQGSAASLDALNSQQNALNVAMAKLGPSGRQFARFLFGLQKGFYSFRNDVQAVLLPAVESAMKSFISSPSAKILRGAMVSLAADFGRFVQALSKSFQGKAWTGFFQTLADLGPGIQAAYGRAFIKMLEALASILTVLAPYALDFANALAALMDRFANWSASKKGADALQGFMDYAQRVAPDVLNFIGALARAFGNLAKALAPYGDLVLGLITDFLNFIANMDTKKLGAFVTGLFALITASQLAYAAMNTLMAGSALLKASLGRLIFTTVGIGLALLYIWQNGGPAAKAIVTIVGVIYGLVLAMRAWRAITITMEALQLGFAAATYGAAGATYAQTGAQQLGMVVGKLWLGVTKALTAAQWLYNAALAANPYVLIALAIVALVVALVILFKKNKTVHDFIIKAWHAIEQAFSAAWKIIKDVVEQLAVAVMWLWENAVKPAMDFIWKAVKVAFTLISWYWNHILWPVWRTLAKILLVLVLATFKAVFIGIKLAVKITFAFIKELWNKSLHPVFTAMGAAAKWLWKKAIKPAMEAIGWLFGKAFNGIKWAWDHTLGPLFDWIGDHVLPKLQNAFQTTVDNISGIWDGLKKIVGKPIKFVLDTVLNHGLIAGFNKVAKWVGLDGFDPIPIPKALQSYATGGVLPGYTPGRDPHKFVSPTGGRLELSGGEAVMRPEWTKAMGAGYVNTMNSIARSKGVQGVRRAMGGAFAGGGIIGNATGLDNPVLLNGMKISKIAAAQIALAQKIYGQAIYMMQGGYGGNHVAASGTSHNYPGVGDFGPGSISLETTLRRVGFAAWARNIPGRAQVGSGAHVHAVSLLDPGDRTSPQVTGSWPQHKDGLGGGPGSDPAPHVALLPNLPKRLAPLMGMDPYALSTLLGGISGGGGGISIPGWIKDIVKGPIKAVTGWMNGAIGKASDMVTSSPVWPIVKGLPGLVVDKLGTKVWDVIPGWVKKAVGVAGDIKDGIVNVVTDPLGTAGDVVHSVGDALGLANGGILPYNGTMMYDNGGYLPPGLTTVMNLTGKPEPVFTDSQFASMQGGGAGAGSIHYEPHFEGSDLTAEDVASDLNFQFRKLRRGGKYQGVGQ